MADPRVARFALPIAAFTGMTGIVLASGVVLFARKIGFATERVQAFYLGSEAAFTGPRSLAGLLEVAVPHLLAIPMVVLVTLHLVAFALSVSRRPFALLAGATSAFVALAIGAGFAIRFLWPTLAPLKIVAFVGLESTMLGWLLLLGAALLPARRSATRPAGLTGSEAAPPRAAR